MIGAPPDGQKKAQGSGGGGGAPMGPPPSALTDGACVADSGGGGGGTSHTTPAAAGSGAPPRAPGPLPSPGRHSSGDQATMMPPGQSLMTAVQWSPIVPDVHMVPDGVSSATFPTPPRLVDGNSRKTDTTNGSQMISHHATTRMPPPPQKPDPSRMPVSATAPMGPPPGGLPSQQQQRQPHRQQQQQRQQATQKQGSSIPVPQYFMGTSTSSKQSAQSPRLSSSAPGRTSTAPPRRSSTGSTGDDVGNLPPGQRRQKRLERNRESARLSRRRRKQYLEVLEERVAQYSEDMDRGRRDHVFAALQTVRHLRASKLKEVERDVGIDMDSSNLMQHASLMESPPPAANIPLLEHHARTLDVALSRTCDELRIANTFQKQQLLSLSLPQHKKFVLWLTIQNDALYRGGRAASERLSAARIGERMLHCGNDKAPPSGGMWPLLCNDVGVSYEQEEKIRNYQRSLIANHDSWLHRHTAAASDATVESMHRAMNGLFEMVQGRERAVLNVLTVEQRVKFQAWAASRQERIARASRTLVARAGSGSYSAPPENSSEEIQCATDRHDAANLYILNRRLEKVCHALPTAPPLVSATTLKKLSRRPSFESLASSTASMEAASGKKLSRDRSFPSSGSLKRAASELSMDDADSHGGGKSKDSVPNITPESAEAAAAPTIAAALNSVRELIPSSPPREFVPTHPAAAHARGHARTHPYEQMQQQHYQIQHHQHAQHQQYPQVHYGQHAPPQGSHGDPQTAAVDYAGVPVSNRGPSHPGAPSPIPVEVQSGDLMMQSHQQVPSTGTRLLAAPSPPQGVGSYVENNHGRIPSVLPPHMNIVPEEGYLNNVSAHGTEDDEFLFDLTEEDWAIGEGFDMDLT